MIELGNMRNASAAAKMTPRRVRPQYADAIVAGVRSYLGGS